MKPCVLVAILILTVFITSCIEQGTLQSVHLEEPQKQIASNSNSPKNTTATKALNTTPLTPSAKGPETCGNATCADDQACVEGKCKCKDGFKQCGSACILLSDCCSDPDCPGTEICVKSKCEFSCTKLICPSNQLCDGSQRGCVCPGGYKYCQIQKKCIPTDYCCDRFDCKRNEICTQTLNSVHVCLNTKQPFCKYLGDKVSKVIEINNATHDITAAEFMYGKKVKIVVDGKPFEMQDGASEKLSDDLTLVVDEVRELGGKCRILNPL